MVGWWLWVFRSPCPSSVILRSVLTISLLEERPPLPLLTRPLINSNFLWMVRKGFSSNLIKELTIKHSKIHCSIKWPASFHSLMAYWLLNNKFEMGLEIEKNNPKHWADRYKWRPFPCVLSLQNAYLEGPIKVPKNKAIITSKCTRKK